MQMRKIKFISIVFTILLTSCDEYKPSNKKEVNDLSDKIEKQNKSNNAADDMKLCHVENFSFTAFNASTSETANGYQSGYSYKGTIPQVGIYELTNFTPDEFEDECFSLGGSVRIKDAGEFYEKKFCVLSDMRYAQMSCANKILEKLENSQKDTTRIFNQGIDDINSLASGKISANITAVDGDSFKGEGVLNQDKDNLKTVYGKCYVPCSLL